MKRAASVRVRILLALAAAVGALFAAFLWGLFCAFGNDPWLALVAAIFSVPPLAAVWLYYRLKRAEVPQPRREAELFPAARPPAPMSRVESPDALLDRIIKDAGADEKARADLQAFLDECRAAGMDDRDASDALLAFARGYFGPALPSAAPSGGRSLAALLSPFAVPLLVLAGFVVIALARLDWLPGPGRPWPGWAVAAITLALAVFLVVSFVCWLRWASARRAREAGLERLFGNTAIGALVTMIVCVVLAGLAGKGVVRLPGDLPWQAGFLVAAGICWTYLSLLYLLLPRQVILDDPFLAAIPRHLRVRSFVGLRFAAAVFVLLPVTFVCMYLLCD